MLPSNDVKQIRSDWKCVVANEERFSTEFYAQLFKLDPELERLFKRSMGRQKQKLVSMFSSAFHCIDRPAELFPLMRMAGRRHLQYDVVVADYKTMEVAFVATMAVMLEGRFDDNQRQLWHKAFTILASLMQGDAPDLP